MTIFTSLFPGGDAEDSRHGMRIIRHGGKYTVYSKARGYVKRHLSEFDVIIDEINTIPFRINTIVRNKKVFAMIHQLAKEVWFYETRFPLSILGYYALEPWFLRGYRQVPTITVSPSTKNDLETLGFENVHIVHNGIGVSPLRTLPEKEPHPVMIFVGRLVRCKLPDHAIGAFRRVKRALPDVELWIVGDGYLRGKFDSDREEGITFFGRVPDQEKLDMLKRAHVLVVPSVREGWGISVIEANAMGTPAVGYDVPGLRDSIVNQHTGLLAEPLNVRALANGVLRILCNPELAGDMSRNALRWSSNFSWDGAAKEFGNILYNGL